MKIARRASVGFMGKVEKARTVSQRYAWAAVARIHVTALGM